MKPKYVLIAAVSLDGKISDDPKHLPDWTSKEDWKWFQKELKTCDAMLVGRKTFEAAKMHIEKRNAFVLSRKKRTDYGSTHFVAPNINLSEMLGGYKRVAIVGGSGVYSYALAHGFADEIYLTLEPVLLGKGISFTKDDVFGRKRLVLIKSKKLNKNGSTLLHYKII